MNSPSGYIELLWDRAVIHKEHHVCVCKLLCFRKLNTLRPRRNEQHLADDIFKHIFFNENVWISIKISLKFVPKGPINNIPALVQIMAWYRSDDKPLSEPMMVSLPTHICITRPQWVNTLRLRQNGRLFQMTFSNGYTWMTMFQFWIWFNWIFFLRVQLRTIQYWSR